MRMRRMIKIWMSELASTLWEDMAKRWNDVVGAD
jgi:hypothetical protein